MPADGQKTPIARTLNQFAERKARAAIDLLGAALPASVISVTSGGIVTVKFELTNVPFTLPNLTVPVFGSEYVRLPIQAGMKGMVMSADAYLGGMTGLGGGPADLTQRPNLSNLAFTPLGNTGWSTTPDANSLWLYGPNGVIFQDTSGVVVGRVDKATSTFTIAINGTVVFTVNASGAVINGGLGLSGPITAADGSSTYAEAIQTSGAVIAGYGGADQVGLQTHTHEQGTDSHGDTEQATDAPTGGT